MCYESIFILFYLGLFVWIKILKSIFDLLLMSQFSWNFTHLCISDGNIIFYHSCILNKEHLLRLTLNNHLCEIHDFQNIQHSFGNNLDTNSATAFANSFISMISKDWNPLPCPSSRRQITFSLSKPASTDHFRPNLGNFFFFSRCMDSPRTSEVVPAYNFFLYPHPFKKIIKSMKNSPINREDTSQLN